ncbi:MAG: ATP-binding protein [Deltaproteobacteria bacterium]
MKELVVISGKGGTGKTTLTASFALLSGNAILADCDVDAPDLHILAHPNVRHAEDFRGGVKARIDPDICSQCGACLDACRYDAVSEEFIVDPFSCEGCSVCYHVCPEGAVILEEGLNGHWYISDTRFGPMVHAALLPGEENSGKLVSLVRNQAKVLAREEEKNLIISDGAPGIGCPVIASVTGADHVVVVTEPTMSGLHDMERAMRLVQGFGIPVSVVINKCDVNSEIEAQIEAFCDEARLPLIGKIPYDASVIRAMVERRCAVENGDGAAKRSVCAIWEQIEQTVIR